MAGIARFIITQRDIGLIPRTFKIGPESISVLPLKSFNPRRLRRKAPEPPRAIHNQLGPNLRLLFCLNILNPNRTLILKHRCININRMPMQHLHPKPLRKQRK